jgi:hypothetical protein
MKDHLMPEMTDPFLAGKKEQRPEVLAVTGADLTRRAAASEWFALAADHPKVAEVLEL